MPRTEPASFAQRRLWFIEQLQAAQAPYTLHAVQRLRFVVEPQLLEQSLHQIALRHEVLRTCFELRDDEVVQSILPAPALALQCIDLRPLPPVEREHEAKQRMSNTLAQRFDLRRGPLLRAELYRLDEADFLLLVAVHHIIFDWQSFQVLFQELDVIYAAAIAGRPHGLEPPAEQYATFAREQRAQLTTQRIESELAFWRDELAGLPILDLPLDRPRPRLPSFRGNQLTMRIEAPLVQALQRQAGAQRTTLFTALLGGLFAALARVCHQSDLAVGLPLTGRDTAARQQAIGFFVDTLVVRLQWNDDPLASELLALARDAMRRVLLHRQLPFEVLVQHLQTEHDLGLNPFFQVGFQLMEQPTSHADANATDPMRRGAMFDLCIDVWPHNGELHARLQFNADIFDAASVEMLSQAFHAALHWLVQPDRRLSELRFDGFVPALGTSVLHGPRRLLKEQTFLDLLADMAERHPDAIAIEDASAGLSYRALVQRVEALAGVLRDRGVEAGSIVVIELPRSPDLVVLQLATWRAAAAFACVDPTWPEARRELVRERTAAALVITADMLRGLMAPAASGPPAHRPAAHDLAYVICTSGSTGVPKAVAIEHRGLLNVAQAQRALFGLCAGRRVAQLSSPTFDASVFEIVLALGSGATLAVAPPGIVAGEALQDFVTGHAVDTVVVPPTVLATADPVRCPSLRLVCVAGESCPADLAERFGAGREFWNLYGPTETTIWATAGRSAVGSKVSIGRPIDNLCTAVVDEQGRVVPVGMTGELCVAGVGLARGYLHEPELTSRAFVAAAPQIGDAAIDGRMYRTGDLVRQLSSGELVFLGRTDRQVKVRGLRIEPEEIERALRGQPGVTDVIVDVTDVHREQVLVAYVQSAPGEPHGALLDACRERVRAQLPAYLCPSRFIALATLPRMSSGKVDRNALPPPDSAQPLTEPALEPCTDTQRMVATIMQQLLQVSRVGAHDDFFRIGGHSLAAAQLAARVHAALGVELSIADVFAHSTVSSLAERIDALRSDATGEVLEEVPLVRLPRSQVEPYANRHSDAGGSQ
jgi:amino acid adenylation domain-containing protein